MSTRHAERPLSMVIFSKDRACQCDSLLRSIRDHFHAPFDGITVLYRATTPAFTAGYEALVKRDYVDKTTWRPETDFMENVRGIVAARDENSLIMFLVDDTVLFRPFDGAGVLDAFTDRHLFISLRASRTYPSDVPPEFITTTPYLEWKWNYSRRNWVTWNYPFSVDGNIFHACHIKKVLKKILFEAPNSFEGRMHTYRHAWWVKRISKALAPAEAVLFNNPLNRVQAEGETWHENVTPELLNGKYLDGMRIDNGALYRAAPSATHYAVPPSWTSQER